MIAGAGLVNIEFSDPVDTFAGASGEVKAREYGTFGYSVRGRKPGRTRDRTHAAKIAAGPAWSPWGLAAERRDNAQCRPDVQLPPPLVRTDAPGGSGNASPNGGSPASAVASGVI